MKSNRGYIIIKAWKYYLILGIVLFALIFALWVIYDAQNSANSSSGNTTENRTGEMPIKSAVVESYEITIFSQPPEYSHEISSFSDNAIYLDKTREVIVTQNVTQTVYTNISTQQWDSVEQCEAWIKAHLVNMWITQATCNDYSIDIQRQSMQEGYPISQALTWDTVYYGKTVNHINNGHAGCMVMINGTYYYFDPQPDLYKGLIKITEVAK
jgi:hypothetical protein